MFYCLVTAGLSSGLPGEIALESDQWVSFQAQDARLLEGGSFKMKDQPDPVKASRDKLLDGSVPPSRESLSRATLDVLVNPDQRTATGYWPCGLILPASRD